MTVDLSGLENLTGKLQGFATPTSVNTDKMLREVAVSINTLMVQRIHEDGKRSDGSPIGTYSPEYIKQRMKHGFSGSSKVVFVWDRQMVNDFSVGNTEPTQLSGGGYGLGFKNEINAVKAEVLQEGMPAHTVPAHTRTSVKGKQYKVKSHTNKGWPGFGSVYFTSEQEREAGILVADDFVNRVMNNK